MQFCNYLRFVYNESGIENERSIANKGGVNRMKRRMFIIMGSILVLSIVWTGCNMVSDLTKGEKERNLIRLKRGSFRNDGFYSNDFYEFELRMPEAWTGNVDDPPNLLTVNPSSRDVAQSSARKFISIVVKVVSFGTD